MGNNSSNNVGTKVSIPGIKKSVKNFKNVADYKYNVTVRGNKGSVETTTFTRDTLTFIRNIISNIVINGFSNNIFGKSFNRDFKFVAINLSKPGFNKVNLKDVDVYLENADTKERFHFNMSNVYKVKGVSFSSTGIRTNYYRNHVFTDKELERRHENQRNWYARNREEIRAKRIAKRSEKNDNKNVVKNTSKKIREKLSPQQLKDKRREYAHKHYMKNRERILKQKKEYNSKNRERRTAYNREWRIKNREYVNAYNRKRYHENHAKRMEYLANYYAKKAEAEKIS